MKQARRQHQTVEEKKNPHFLEHQLASGLARDCPHQPRSHFLTEVQLWRGVAVDRHGSIGRNWLNSPSRSTSKSCGNLYFTIFSLLTLLAIILPLVSKSPPTKSRDGSHRKRWRSSHWISSQTVNKVCGCAARARVRRAALSCRRAARELQGEREHDAHRKTLRGLGRYHPRCA